MPRQGKKRPAPEAEETPEAKRHREEVEAGFRLHCKAVLFTWNCKEPKSADDAYGELSTLPHWELVMWYTICAEEGSHWHIHAYVEFKKRVDHSADGWKLWGVAPDIRANTTSGSGFNQAVRRGSFYVANEYKKTFRSHLMNFVPGQHYSVKTQWVIDQWSQDKLRDPVECAGKYRCLTPPFKAMVSMSQGAISSLERREFISQRNLELAQQRKAFKVYEAVTLFTEQFKTTQARYNFLWIWGESKLGKTELAKSLAEHYWHHRNSINWAEYRADKHIAVIFDDCGEPEVYITNHKMLFQANEITTVNTSRTKCFALEVDCVQKMIIVCANHPPYTAWVLANCFVLHVTEPTWAL